MPLRDDGGIPILVRRPPSGTVTSPGDVLADLQRPEPLDILRVQQATDAWCYAACTEMVINCIIGLATVEQCAIAGFVKSSLGENVDCCNGVDPRCAASGCTVGDFGQIFNRWEIAFEGDDDPENPPGPASLSQLQDEFDATRPVLVRVEWDDTGAHALLVTGVDGSEVHVIDPLRGNPYGGWVRYGYLEDGFGKGNWTETWMGLKERQEDV